MNKTAIKNFAIDARNMLIQSATQMAYEYEIEDGKDLDENQSSIGDKALSDTEFSQRKQLVRRIREYGFQNVIEEVAYTWFNRFTALRFMEVNGYLPSKVRVFTDDEGNFKPMIIKEALTVEIDGLDREKILALIDKQDNERLYKYLLITQCNALSSCLPEMFEKFGGWTELLFPQNLLREGSVIDRMVDTSQIPEEDWKDQVQIIGWLYQYYNSEPKDKVFADLKKNIKISKENIPAATQLFTPDWIVRYMVENSLGRLWADGHEDFDKSQWRYYLDEAEQEESVKAQLDKIKEEYSGISPEEIKFIDPCMGSGHILVYAFDVLMQIYTSCGWSERDAAKSILQKNLYGLDIDKRACQLAYFALMMKARKHNRRILTSDVQPNLTHFKDVSNIDTSLLDEPLRSFVEQFRFADTYGSLLEINAPDDLDAAVSDFAPMIGFDRDTLEHMMRIYKILSQKYDVVVTNPPYMGGSGMNEELAKFVKEKYPDSKSDLFAVFIEKNGRFAKEHGLYSMITQHAWMFLSSYEKLRGKLSHKTFVNMAHLGARAFDEIGGEVVQTTAFVNFNRHINDNLGKYVRLVDINGEKEKEEKFLSGENRYTAKQEHFSKIPGVPVAYWVSENFVRAFESNIRLSNFSTYMVSGNKTANNDKYLRYLWEINKNNIEYKWFLYAKGGAFRKWYGNIEFVIDWSEKAQNEYKANTSACIIKKDYWFKTGFTYTDLTSKAFSCRLLTKNMFFDMSGPGVIFENTNLSYAMALFNSVVINDYFSVLNSSFHFKLNDLNRIPIIMSQIDIDSINSIVDENVNISKEDWDAFETSWDFKGHPLI